MYKNEDVFAQNFRINFYNTRSGDHYVPSPQRLSLTFNQSIWNQALQNWHNVPISVKNSPSVMCFKKNYKKHLISFYQFESL